MSVKSYWESILNFNGHLSDIINKDNHKVNASSRVVPYINLSKKKTLNSFFKSQFSHCTLITLRKIKSVA